MVFRVQCPGMSPAKYPTCTESHSFAACVTTLPRKTRFLLLAKLYQTGLITRRVTTEDFMELISLGKYSTISVLNRKGEKVEFKQKCYDLKECSSTEQQRQGVFQTL